MSERASSKYSEASVGYIHNTDWAGELLKVIH